MLFLVLSTLIRLLLRLRHALLYSVMVSVAVCLTIFNITLMMKIDLLKFPCENPKVIIHPSAEHFLLRCDGLLLGHQSFQHYGAEQRDLYFSGRPLTRIFSFSIPFIRSFQSLFEYCQRNGFDFHDNAVSYYNDLSDFLNGSCFVDSTTGETFPLFLVVPCGHCDSCLSKKEYALQQQSDFEFLSNKGINLFLTLTYNEKYLPKDGVQKRHIQLFKKRFKQLIARSYSYKDSVQLKFLCTSEYGGESQRPHYHMLVFNVPFHIPRGLLYHMFMFCWREPERYSNGRYVSFKEYKDLYPKVFNRSSDYDPLSFGFINIQWIDNANSVSYITKYSFKDDSHPVDKNPNFILRSNNLGVDFVMKNKQQLLDSLDGKFTYTDFQRNVVKRVNLCGYYLHKLFPSVCDLIPSDFRNAMRDLFYYGSLISTFNDFSPDIKVSVLSTMVYVQDRYPDFTYHYCRITPQSCRDLFEKSFVINEFTTAANLILNYKFLDFKEIFNQISLRDLFFQKFENQPYISRLDNSFNKFHKNKCINQSKSKL